MRQILRYALLAAMLLSSIACGQKGARLQKSVVPPDKTLFETGQEYLDKSQFIKARLAFQTLINTYPDSELTSESYLAIGDSFYDEGGTENLLQAEDQFKNFIIFFPTHPKAADAQLKIASLNIKMMRAPDRDPQYSFKALEATKKFLQDYPDSEYVPIVKKYLAEVQENLAQREFGISTFYAGRGNYRASKSRLKELVENYPDYSLMDEAYYLYAQSLEKTEDSDGAATYYAKIRQGFPFSKHFEEAKARLESLGKPIPEIDTLLAAQNQSRLKPSEGFSPLKPFTDFAKALGFIGPPDPYENAKRTVLEQQEAAAARAQTADGTKAGDDILIETTLTKSKTGETEQSTVLGGSAAPSNPSAKKDDKKGSEKKAENKKTDSKKNPKK